MELIILIPAVVCCVVIARDSIRSALINVYLPSVLLLPQFFELRFPHLPPITFAAAAILPLGLALCFTELRHWRFDWMDLLVVLFAVSAAVSEGLSSVLADGSWVRLFTSPAEKLHTNLGNGVFLLAAGVTTIILPYMLGKLLIEQGQYRGQPVRKAILQRLVVLLGFVATLSLFDFLTGTSSWQLVFKHLFPGQPLAWPMQVRWGLGRIAGPYAHAILAGMIFLIGLTYCIWLRRFAPEWGNRKLINGLPFTPRGMVLFAIVAGLLMTQSRGPWLGVVLAVVFFALMRTLPVSKATAVFLVIIGVLLVAGYFLGKAYTNAPPGQATSEEQSSAIYRRDLVHNYIPAVLARKAFGWGITTRPTMAGQESIDNEYLVLAVTQGFTGLFLFLAIVGGCAARLLWLSARSISIEDHGLVFAHLAVLIGLMTALATVYLGEQAFLLFFLILGWVQGMNPARVSTRSLPAMAPRFEFRRVLT
jgi:hypothetical protein